MSVVTLKNGVTFDAGAEETILDAARRGSVVLEHSCRTGRCGVCKARVLEGSCTPLKNEESLTAAEVSANWILTCARAARSDLRLNIEDLGRLAGIEIKIQPCRIDSIRALAPDVVAVVLRMPPTTVFNYLPGQYVDVIAKSGIRRSYSLANALRPDGKLELHIRMVANGEMSAYWFSTAAANDLLRIEGPFGTFCLRDKAQHLIFMATGTGIAPVKAMLEELAAEPGKMQGKRISVYWGGRNPEDIYYPLLSFGMDMHYVPVLSRAAPDWQGRRGYVQQAVLQDVKDFSDAVIYACGSSAMISSAREALLAAGLAEDNFYSDAFLSSS